MMKLCANGHHQVAYEDNINCPVCTLIEDLKNVKTLVASIKDEVRDLREKRNLNDEVTGIGFLGSNK